MSALKFKLKDHKNKFKMCTLFQGVTVSRLMPKFHDLNYICYNECEMFHIKEKTVFIIL